MNRWFRSPQDQTRELESIEELAAPMAVKAFKLGVLAVEALISIAYEVQKNRVTFERWAERR